MTINSLTVSNCRIISHTEIKPSPNFNLVYGHNGSGKSTLLEAIYLLGTGRSFRSNLISSIIKKGESSLVVSAKVKTQSGQEITVGMERGKNLNRLHINRSPIQRLSEAAELLPTQIITPDSINLVMGSPRGRRSFLDWGMFHVERSFLSTSKNYKKTLRQRNALLKRKELSNNEILYWNQALSDYGEMITTGRVNYLGEVVRHYRDNLFGTLASLSDMNIEFDYRRGWRDSITLHEALEQTANREKIVGHTVVGPHEADLVIKSRDGSAKNILSRGQAKLLSVGLYLSQLSHLYEKTGKRGVVLVDDLFSEMDRKNSMAILDYLISSGYQVFATTTEGGSPCFDGRGVKMFHVEHGEILNRSNQH